MALLYLSPCIAALLLLLLVILATGRQERPVKARLTDVPTPLPVLSRLDFSDGIVTSTDIPNTEGMLARLPPAGATWTTWHTYEVPAEVVDFLRVRTAKLVSLTQLSELNRAQTKESWAKLRHRLELNYQAVRAVGDGLCDGLENYALLCEDDEASVFLNPLWSTVTTSPSRITQAELLGTPSSDAPTTAKDGEMGEEVVGCGGDTSMDAVAKAVCGRIEGEGMKSALRICRTYRSRMVQYKNTIEEQLAQTEPSS